MLHCGSIVVVIVIIIVVVVMMMTVEECRSAVDMNGRMKVT